MKRVAALVAALLVATAAGAAADKRTDGALLPRDSRDAAVFRGGLVYANYCVTCHGINADGNGRAARLHTPRPANLRASDKNDQYIKLIISKGGEPIGRSPGMPPWAEELTDEQINDVTAFVRSVNQR
ncbi:cytochrome c [Aquincola sp. S2]|uniref:Cytochrome c n=1 Tax=Pseudaquabacterium terrae TaxID=2732868 RepID=A0ABX2EQ74_9BURK|nr:cytochrome c [Aquabacterium terrae]NRF70676.1 cytochrome c [Aquabacterium terrae]